MQTSTETSMRHVRVNGFRFDRRMRMGTKRKTVSDGRTLCGASSTALDVNLENAVGTLRIASIQHPQADYARRAVAEMCPNCLTALREQGH